MGFRFQRRVTLFPGVRLNFSARGISATIGPRGASVNVGARGSAVNLGIPGTGLSFRHTLGAPTRPDRTTSPQAIPEAEPRPSVEPPRPPGTAIESAPVEQVTSDGLKALKDLILQVRDERDRLRTSIMEASRELAHAKARLSRAQHWLLGLFLKKHLPQRTADVEDWAANVRELEEQLEGSVVDTEFGLDETALQEFKKLTDGFRGAAKCERIWDITTTSANDRRATRSLATSAISRVPVRFGLIEEDEVLRTEGKALRLQNANGSDLAIYPGFLLMRDGVRVGLLDLRELVVEFTRTKFIETEKVPSDGVVVGQTWAKTNRDGSPDRRFRENYQIPIVQYGEVALSSSTGINESYQFSNADKAEAFAEALRSYQSALKALGERSPEEQASANPNPDTGGSPDAPEAAMGDLGAVEFLAGRSAASFDDAKDTLSSFFELLKKDVESLNGAARKTTELEAFVGSLPGVMVALRAYCDRSPAAEALSEVSRRETSRMLGAVLDQLEVALEPHKATEEFASLGLAVARTRSLVSP